MEAERCFVWRWVLMAAPKQMLKHIAVDKNMPRQLSALVCHAFLVDFARLVPQLGHHCVQLTLDS